MLNVDLSSLLAGIAVTGIIAAIIAVASMAAFVKLTGRGINQVMDMLNEIGEERRSEREYQKFIQRQKRKNRLQSNLKKRDHLRSVFYTPERVPSLGNPSLSNRRVSEYLRKNHNIWSGDNIW